MRQIIPPTKTKWIQKSLSAWWATWCNLRPEHDIHWSCHKHTLLIVDAHYGLDICLQSKPKIMKNWITKLGQWHHHFSLWSQPCLSILKFLMNVASPLHGNLFHLPGCNSTNYKIPVLLNVHTLTLAPFNTWPWFNLAVEQLEVNTLLNKINMYFSHMLSLHQKSGNPSNWFVQNSHTYETL